jgi:integrase
MALTDLKIKNAKPKNLPYRLSDSGGLHLYVSPAGGKLWRWKYRFGSKEKLMSFGSYPEVSLVAARAMHQEQRAKLAAGTDPMAERKAEKTVHLRKAENSFERVAKAWFAKWKHGKCQRHADYMARRMEADILPRLGPRQIDEIQPPDIVAMIQAIEERGATDVARRALQSTNQIFRYAVALGYVQHNPASAFRPGDVLPQKPTENFPRLDKAELPELLRKIESYDGSPFTRLAMKMMALVFVRTSELICAEWKEFDMKEARWDIPKERMKGGKRPHIVPLARQTVAVLNELWNFRKNDRWVFPGDRDDKKHMSNNTILGALKRMGFKGEMTGHGFRGIASTIMHEQGYNHEHIEIQLHHGPDNDVSAAYNHAKYLEPRKKLMQDWADYLDKTRNSGKPVPFIVKKEAKSRARQARSAS